jgi:preprotein translocase subunit Sec61beta
MTTETFGQSPRDKSHKLAPRYVTYSAIAVPVMVLTGWAFFASIPVALMTWGAWTDRRIRALRWWAGLTAVLYAIPFVQYLVRADAELSMSDMLHPLMGAAIAVPAVVVILKIFRSHRG